MKYLQLFVNKLDFCIAIKELNGKVIIKEREMVHGALVLLARRQWRPHLPNLQQLNLNRILEIGGWVPLSHSHNHFIIDKMSEDDPTDNL